MKLIIDRFYKNAQVDASFKELSIIAEDDNCEFLLREKALKIDDYFKYNINLMAQDEYNFLKSKLMCLPDALLCYKDEYYLIEFQKKCNSHKEKDHIAKFSEFCSFIKYLLSKNSSCNIQYQSSKIPIIKYIVLINDLGSYEKTVDNNYKFQNTEKIKESSSLSNAAILSRLETNNIEGYKDIRGYRGLVNILYSEKVHRLNVVSIQNFGFSCSFNFVKYIKTIDDLVNC